MNDLNHIKDLNGRHFRIRLFHLFINVKISPEQEKPEEKTKSTKFIIIYFIFFVT